MLGAILNCTEQALMHQLFINKEAPLTQKSRTGILLFAMSAFLLCLGTGFLLFALYLWMSVQLSAEFAAFLTGMITLILSIILSLCAINALKMKIKANPRASYQGDANPKGNPTPAAITRQDLEEILPIALEYMEYGLKEPVRQNPKTSLLLAGLAGLLAGRKL